MHSSAAKFPGQPATLPIDGSGTSILSRSGVVRTIVAIFVFGALGLMYSPIRHALRNVAADRGKDRRVGDRFLACSTCVWAVSIAALADATATSAVS